MAEPTKGQTAAAEDILKPPPAKDLEVVRARRREVADILNTNLLAPDTRKRYESLYAETGDILERAVKAAEK